MIDGPEYKQGGVRIPFVVVLGGFGLLAAALVMFAVGVISGLNSPI